MQTFPYVDLSHYPMIQVAVIAVIIGTWVVGVFHGLRQRSAPQQYRGDHDTRNLWAFDGPVKVALDALKGIYRVLDELRRDHVSTSQEVHEMRSLLEECTRELRESRRVLEDVRNDLRP